MSLPLAGVRVVELAGIGPAPYGVMLLADFGAEVVRLDRTASARGAPGREARYVPLSGGRRSVAVDLKHPDGLSILLDLVDTADVLVDPYRPGAMERLGAGPDVCCARNPRLVYARLTGWGQEGPDAGRAGHDLNYAAVAGALWAIGYEDAPPPPPLNLLADFAGGSLFFAVGVLLALQERAVSGRGQVVDVAMVDGVASLTAYFHGLLELGEWEERRESNDLDGAAPYYRCYETADGAYLAVAAIESKFYAILLDLLGLDPREWPQHDRDQWSAQRKALAGIFASRTRAEWEETFAGTDACVTPVLTFGEAVHHPHNEARGTFVRHDFGVRPGPAPRLSRTPGRPAPATPRFGHDTRSVLRELGRSDGQIERLLGQGVVA